MFKTVVVNNLNFVYEHKDGHTYIYQIVPGERDQNYDLHYIAWRKYCCAPEARVVKIISKFFEWEKRTLTPLEKPRSIDDYHRFKRDSLRSVPEGLNRGAILRYQGDHLHQLVIKMLHQLQVANLFNTGKAKV